MLNEKNVFLVRFSSTSEETLEVSFAYFDVVMNYSNYNFLNFDSFGVGGVNIFRKKKKRKMICGKKEVNKVSFTQN